MLVVRKAAATAGPAVTVLPVQSTRSRRAFVAFPYALYRDSPFWVTSLRRDLVRTLNPRENPFLEHSTIAPWVAVDGSGSVVGRIAAIVNRRHLETYTDSTGFFGFFECVDDYAVAEALFDTAGAWLRREGLTAIRGPANPSLNESCGVLIEGFDRAPSVLMPYNLCYYEEFMLRWGFRRAMTMSAYKLSATDLNLARLERGAECVRRRSPGMQVRNPRMERFEEEGRLMWRLYNDAFAGTWGFVPLTEREFLDMARQMKPILDPDLVLFLEHDGVPVGFSLSIPNMNLLLRHVKDGRLWPFGFLKLIVSRWREPQLHEFRVAVLAVLPGYRRKGLDSLLVLTTIQEGLRRGYTSSELSWILDTNIGLRNSLEGLGATVDKGYALLERRLPDADSSDVRNVSSFVE